VIRLLSWNVFRNRRPATIERSLQGLVQKYHPHVVFLQEAPQGEKGSPWEIDALNGFHRLYAPVFEILVQSHRFGFDSTGQLTLSCFPFESTETYILPAVPRFLERKAGPVARVVRRVPYARIRLPSGRTLGLHNVHLENRTLPSGRHLQVRHLLEVVDQKDDDVAVVGGDLNTFFGRNLEACLRLFARRGFTRLIGMARIRGLPALDYVLVRGALRTEAVPVRATGSDHYPVLVDIDPG